MLAPFLALAAGAFALEDPRAAYATGRIDLGMWRAMSTQMDMQSDTPQLAISSKHAKWPAYCFDQKISHFEDVDGTFCQRYWADARYYREGGPIYVLDGGETSGANRIPFLETGILQILAEATGGLSIVLEHRYYGKSVPVESFSTDDLRFLNNEEALEDSAEFIRKFSPPSSLVNVSDPGIFRPDRSPWIYYGGSYAGARAAHMIVEHPDLVWGAIASSAVTHAQIDFPQYFDPIEQYGDPKCIKALRRSVETVDELLDAGGHKAKDIKRLFGLAELEDDDFASTISSMLGGWQGQNWDANVGSQSWHKFCRALTAKKVRHAEIAGAKLAPELVNYAHYINASVVEACKGDIVECFGSRNETAHQLTDLSQTWRLWLFQVCTQWGYFMPAHKDRPSLISQRITLDYSRKICKSAFPPGDKFSVPEWPDVESVNRRGDYGIKAHRLAFIDGDRDPWRVMTPQSELAPKRKSSVDMPVHLIFDAVHHYDENGLAKHDDEPDRIKDVHAFEKLFVQEWLSQWEEQKQR